MMTLLSISPAIQGAGGDETGSNNPDADQEVSSSSQSTTPTTPGNTRLLFVTRPFRASGMYGARSFPVYVPEDWLISDQGGRMGLELDVSSLLEHANVTVLLNQVQLDTRAIVPAETRPWLLEMDVPARAVVPGWNVVEVRFYLRASDDPCEDVDNPGLWAWLGAGSFLDLPHTQQIATPDLSRFPQSYVSCGPEDRTGPNQITFILPPDPGREALEIAAVLAARLGGARLCPPDRIQATFLKGPRPDLRNTHLVLVGDSSLLDALETWGIPSSPLKKRIETLRDEYPPGPRFGALIEATHPDNPHRRFLVAIGSDIEGMRILRANLGNGQVLERLEGSQALFLDTPPYPHSPPRDPTRISFKSLNQDDIVLRGITTRSFNLTIPLPRNWTLDATAHLHLILRHPVSFQRTSALEVTIGDVPAYRREFVPEVGPPGTREIACDVPIPPRFASADALRIGFNLFIDVGTDDCARPYDDSLWVIISRESEARLAHLPTEDLDLDAYPDLFVREPSLSTTGLVLDDDSGVHGAGALLVAAAAIGARAGTTGDIDLQVLRAREFDHLSPDEKAARAWIVIDTADLEPAVRPLGAWAPLALDERGHMAVEARIRYAIPRNASHAALWQLFQPPWGSRPVLLLSAESADAVALNKTPLGRVWGDFRLHGNVALLFPPQEEGARETPGRTLSLDVPPRTPPEEPAPSPPARGSRWLWLLASIAGFVLALTLLRGLLRRKRG